MGDESHDFRGPPAVVFYELQGADVPRTAINHFIIKELPVYINAIGGIESVSKEKKLKSLLINSDILNISN
jgi:hypothetical protein